MPPGTFRALGKGKDRLTTVAMLKRINKVFKATEFYIAKSLNGAVTCFAAMTTSMRKI